MQSILYRSRQAISLIEMLVSIAIIAVLFAIILPAVQQTRNTALRLDCSSRLRNIGIAAQNYHSSEGTFPAGCKYKYPDDPNLIYSQAGMSWHTSLLAELEQGELALLANAEYEQAPLSRGYTSEAALLQITSRVVPIFLCPSESRVRARGISDPNFSWTLTSFAGIPGTYPNVNNGVLPIGRGIDIGQILDGSSQTIMVGERPPSPLTRNGWYSYADGCTCRISQVLDVSGAKMDTNCPDIPFAFAKGKVEDYCSFGRFWSLHSGGGNFLFADGSVKFLRYSAAPLLPALASRDGGEVFTLD